MLDPLRYSLKLALTTAVVWTIGVLGLLAVALSTGRQAGETELDLQLETQAWAVYGLAWIDIDGKFHSEVLDKETELLGNGLDVYVIGPNDVVYASPNNRFRADLLDVAAAVIESEEDRVESGVDAGGAAYRLVAKPTYDDDDQVVAAIIVLGDPEPVNAAWRALAMQMGIASTVLIAMGIGFSGVLAQRTLRPLERSIRDRHQVLAAAAHELRTPVATLQAMVESARAGDEPADVALDRLAETIVSTGEMVDRLLTWSRLGEAPLERERLRLDLLVESLLEEGESADLTETVVNGDPRLLRIAVSNLLENARRHGKGVHWVSVDTGAVVVSDNGPGFPEVDNLMDPFVRGPGSSGTGLGLALAHQIAKRHGGGLALGPGGRARLWVS